MPTNTISLELSTWNTHSLGMVASVTIPTIAEDVIVETKMEASLLGVMGVLGVMSLGNARPPIALKN